MQSLADAAKSKLGGAGLVKAAAGSPATFSIKVRLSSADGCLNADA